MEVEAGLGATRRVVLDTSAYSWLVSGHAGIGRYVAAAEIVYVPATTLGELTAGFILGTREAGNRRALAEFVDQPFAQVLDITPRVAERYGRIFAGLRRQGSPIPTNDIWIAATAMEAGAHLLTFDSDFTRVEGLAHTLLAPS